MGFLVVCVLGVWDGSLGAMERSGLGCDVGFELKNPTGIEVGL